MNKPIPDTISLAIDTAIANIAGGMRALLEINPLLHNSAELHGESQMPRTSPAAPSTALIQGAEIANPAISERYDVWVVDRYESSAGEERSSWIRVGVAFPHKDGLGMNVELNAVPVNGKLVIRRHEPKRDSPLG